MSRETVELVRRAYGAFNRGDLEAMVLVAAPEFDVATGAIPGAGGVYRGPEEFVQFLDRWWGEFDEPRVEVHELIEARDQVLASVTFRGHGKQSGVEANWNLLTAMAGPGRQVRARTGIHEQARGPRRGGGARVGRRRPRWTPGPPS